MSHRALGPQFEPAKSTKHAYAEYTDDTELAYHLHYDHGMPLANAMKALQDDTVVRDHRGAHS